LTNLPFGNRLLDTLPPELGAALRPLVEAVLLPAGQVIQEPEDVLDACFFPTRGVISMVALTAEGQSIEIGMIGSEGMFSVGTLLGDDAPAQRAMVQIAGDGWRIGAAALRREVEAHAPLRTLLSRYTQATLSTVAQTAACNRLHLLEQRCARWLLSAHDGAGGDQFAMTHEFLAMMLGVRRPGVSVALQALQNSALIAYNHGTMNILDRAGLERSSCECYAAIQREFRRLLPG
jgi:CRP-like cAMP-binding protein